MIDSCKDYISPKTFGIGGFACVIAHFVCGVVLTPFTKMLRESENGKFSCSVDPKSTATYKKLVDQACFARYDQTYIPHLPLYGFVPLSIGIPVLLSVIYSLTIVRTRVNEIESRYERQNDGQTEKHEQDRKTLYVFYSYFFHLLARALIGIILTVLQHTYFYSKGFDFKFSCNYNYSTLVPCENTTASEKRSCGIIVSLINSIVALFILGEVIYLCWRRSTFEDDYDFVVSYFLDHGEYQTVPSEPPMDDESREPPVNVHKEQVLNRFHIKIRQYGPNTSRLDEIDVKIVIHTERVQHKLNKDEEKHEMYHVYTKAPSTSTEKIENLFYRNKGTPEEDFPLRILVTGRPGIGKTVLAEKILRDWANGVDQYYRDKIAFFFKFVWFNDNHLGDISLKTFLRFGTELNEEQFESIYEEVQKEPRKAILIFDGLDEFNGNISISGLEHSRTATNDPNTCRMSAMKFFITLVLREMWEEATVLVTSRPTEDNFYSKLHFDIVDRNVEIIGFTRDKIEKHVKQYCDDSNRSDLAPMILNHIESSTKLSNLCYIPVNLFIVCVTLYECLTRPENETRSIPKTATELYLTAVEKHQENIKALRKLAFEGMRDGQLIFNRGLSPNQIEASADLLNRFSNPISQLQTQFCFINLTIQEFLAARHVIETFSPDERKKFIEEHIHSGKWHLVLQFICGLWVKKTTLFGRDYRECISAFGENYFEDFRDELIYNR